MNNLSRSPTELYPLRQVLLRKNSWKKKKKKPISEEKESGYLQFLKQEEKKEQN